ncbi:MAG: hypothetical protein HKP61_14520 [Dactylosporangium sp.]|nr:hypothetical protein [Dactylosporangium sp.]
MSLDAAYWDLIWQGQKIHEFRRRFLTGPATWYVYLTAPESRLAGVIDLDPPIIDTPQRIAAIAEAVRAGNGTSVYTYLADLSQGYAMPIRQIREYPAIGINDLRRTLGTFHPPQGYTLLGRHPDLAAICRHLTEGPPLRSLAITHPAPAPTITQ